MTGGEGVLSLLILFQIWISFFQLQFTLLLFFKVKKEEEKKHIFAYLRFSWLILLLKYLDILKNKFLKVSESFVNLSMFFRDTSLSLSRSKSRSLLASKRRSKTYVVDRTSSLRSESGPSSRQRSESGPGYRQRFESGPGSRQISGSGPGSRQCNESRTTPLRQLSINQSIYLYLLELIGPRRLLLLLEHSTMGFHRRGSLIPSKVLCKRENSPFFQAIQRES